MQRAFDVCERFQAEPNIETRYFYISRRSIIACVRELNEAQAIKHDFSIHDWLDSIGMDVSQARRVLGDAADLDAAVNLSESPDYRALMTDAGFVDAFECRIGENHRLLRAYLEQQLEDGRFNFADIGWKGTTQRLIETGFGIPTRGYYLGIQRDVRADQQADGDMTGLVFDERKPGPYDEYLSTNIALYEQILAAPHGTVTGYKEENGRIVPLMEWDPLEKALYEEYIASLQDRMIQVIEGLAVWETGKTRQETENWFMARIALKSSLFGSAKRTKVAQRFNSSFVQGTRGGTRGNVKYDYSKLRFGLNIFYRPERYARFLTKVPQVKALFRRLPVRAAYRVIAPIFYGYVYLVQSIKNKLA